MQAAILLDQRRAVIGDHPSQGVFEGIFRGGSAGQWLHAGDRKGRCPHRPNAWDHAAHDRTRGAELAAPLVLAARQLAEDVFLDPTQQVGRLVLAQRDAQPRGRDGRERGVTQ